MNKSLFFRNRIYRFLILIFSFTLFIYLLYFIINPDTGITGYHKIKYQNSLLKEELFLLKNQNNLLDDRISRLSPDSLDLDYLDEQLRKNTGKAYKNEIVINFNN